MSDQWRISRYISYMCSYPHKTVYRASNPPVSLAPYFERPVEGQVSLRFHIPFCVHKCGYCDLFPQQSYDGGRASAYLRMVRCQAEQLSMATQDLKLALFAIGGGTLLILDEKQLDELFCIAELLGVHPSGVFTSIETLPEHADRRILQQLRTGGMRWLSMGVQGLNDTELKKLKRRSVLAIVIDALQGTQEADFPQLNPDPIYGIGEQAVDSFVYSFITALTYRPDELFIYPPYVWPDTRIDIRSTGDMCYAIYRSVRELSVKQGFVQASMHRFIRRGAVELKLSCGGKTMLSCGSGGRSYLGDLHCVIPYAVQQEAITGEVDRHIRIVDFLTVADSYSFSVEGVQMRFIIENLMYYRGLGTAEYGRRFGKEPDGTLFRKFTDRGWIKGKNRALLFVGEGIVYSDCIGQPFASSAVGKLMSEYIYP